MRRPSALVPVIAGFGVVLLLLLAVAVIGVTHIRLISDQLSAIVSERNQKAEAAATMRGLHEARYQALLLADSQPDPFLRDEEMMHFSRLAEDFLKTRERFLSLPLDEEELDLWNSLRGEVRKVEELALSVFEMLQADQLGNARQMIKQTLLPHQRRMMEGWEKLLDMQRAKNSNAVQEVKAIRDRVRNLVLALSATALAVGVIITIVVVRLSRRLEKALFEEKERAQVTLQAIGDGVIRVDTKQRIGYLNPAAELMLGLTRDETLGRPVNDILKLFERESRADITPGMAAT